MNGDEMLDKMLERLNREFDNADKPQMIKYEMLYHMNELAETFHTVLYVKKGTIAEKLLCGGTEKYGCAEFKKSASEPFEPVSDETEVTYRP